MKLDLENTNGEIEFSVGATRMELYGFGAAIISVVTWICRHFQ